MHIVVDTSPSGNMAFGFGLTEVRPGLQASGWNIFAGDQQAFCLAFHASWRKWLGAMATVSTQTLLHSMQTGEMGVGDHTQWHQSQPGPARGERKGGSNSLRGVDSFLGCF
jgi:hypothetical protein